MHTVKVIAMINQKGGVGKTTSVVNLGAALAAAGRSVCLIDLDPQAHMTLHLCPEPPAGPSTYDLLTQQASMDAVAVKAADRLWMAPAVIDLAAAEMELAGVAGREQILRKELAATAAADWEFVLIDCPPSLGLLTLNALAAADEVIIPLQPHFLALQGLGKLLETISLVQHRINPRLRVAGVILCMYEANTRLAGEVVADLEAFFATAKGTDSPWSNARIFKSIIRRNIKLAESPSFGQTIFQYEPASHGAADYAALAGEFVEWDQLRRQEDQAHAAAETARKQATAAADTAIETDQP
ncbi:MAG: ParA family protein [Planctomycetaceae bacterium]|nr:ParA family protein [Planctomycetaceae bacterium]